MSVSLPVRPDGPASTPTIAGEEILSEEGTFSGGLRFFDFETTVETGVSYRFVAFGDGSPFFGDENGGLTNFSLDVFEFQETSNFGFAEIGASFTVNNGDIAPLTISLRNSLATNQSGIIVGSFDTGDFILLQISETVFDDTDNLIVTSDDASDLIIAGSGDDFILASAGFDSYLGELGNDTVSYEDITGSEGVVISGNVGFEGAAQGQVLVDIENIIGTDNADIIENTDNGANLFGGAGDDVLIGGSGGEEIFGDSGADVLNGGAGEDTLDGGFGDDDINGDAGNDVLFGGLGLGEDVLSGGAGDDTINGQNGADQLFGGTGNDTLSGQNRNDVLQGEGGEDTLNGNRGQDTLLGGDDNDTLLGGQGDDQVSGQNGDDELFGGGNNDTLNGGSGDDTLDGGSGIDTLNGGSGEDTLLGGNSNDVLNGGGGVDVLQGGQGNDILTGGSSSTDTFFFDTATDGGVDTITDYQDGLDIIEFAGGMSFADLTIRQATNGDDTIVEVNGSDVAIRIADTDAADITVDDFVFEDDFALV